MAKAHHAWVTRVQQVYTGQRREAFGEGLGQRPASAAGDVARPAGRQRVYGDTGTDLGTMERTASSA
ncbi:MAG: hypothetical protein CM1200mP26_18930 [Acidimicrobiales bacterium]|nr:MAG: hypothetical protein CM1200mP26_18930 [Acidimicrobiales bacterium]